MRGGLGSSRAPVQEERKLDEGNIGKREEGREGREGWEGWGVDYSKEEGGRVGRRGGGMVYSHNNYTKTKKTQSHRHVHVGEDGLARR